MKMNKKMLKFFLMSIVIELILLCTTNVQATLQANQNTQYTKRIHGKSWLSTIRSMEAAGGTMGLTESFNSDLTSKESNNIDVHMIRSTEYGAIAILSASSYGNPSNERNITSTTGNNTGIILTMLTDLSYKYEHGGRNNIYYEAVAGTNSEGRLFQNINNRYFDIYTFDNNSARKGDALGTSGTSNPGANGWHSALANYWFGNLEKIFIRGSLGIFSFREGDPDSYYSATYASRGVAVCGEGF